MMQLPINSVNNGAIAAPHIPKKYMNIKDRIIFERLEMTINRVTFWGQLIAFIKLENPVPNGIKKTAASTLNTKILSQPPDNCFHEGDR